MIEYLNQVKYHSRVQEKIKQVKYLKDQFELKAKTNLAELMQQKNDVVFESRPAYPLKLSLDLLHTDEGNQSVRKVADKLKQAKRPSMAVAESIASDDLLPQTEEEIYIDLEEIRNGFTASGRHLYNYIMQYNYPREVSYEEKITIFCQMVSMYEQDFVIKEAYQDDGTVEYAVVLPR